MSREEEIRQEISARIERNQEWAKTARAQAEKHEEATRQLRLLLDWLAERAVQRGRR